MTGDNHYSLQTIKKKLKPFFSKHHIIKALVFGSYARNTENRKSDLDLLLVMETNKRFFDRLSKRRFRKEL